MSRILGEIAQAYPSLAKELSSRELLDKAQNAELRKIIEQITRE